MSYDARKLVMALRDNTSRERRQHSQMCWMGSVLRQGPVATLDLHEKMAGLVRGTGN